MKRSMIRSILFAAPCAGMLVVAPAAFCEDAAPPVGPETEKIPDPGMMDGKDARKVELPERLEARQQSLADRAYLALATSPSLRTSNFTVTADKGAVTVAGSVPTEGARERALYLASTPRGVRSVVDRIEVDASLAQATTNTAADASLVAKVASAIAAEFPDAEPKQEWAYGWEIEHEEWAMDVDADLGYIFLDGTVPTWPAAKLAVDTARRVPGVVGVEQHLRVGSPMQHDRDAVGYGFDEDAYWYDHPKKQYQQPKRAGDAPPADEPSSPAK